MGATLSSLRKRANTQFNGYLGWRLLDRGLRRIGYDILTTSVDLIIAIATEPLEIIVFYYDSEDEKWRYRRIRPFG